MRHRETGVGQTLHHLFDLGYNVLGVDNCDDFVGVFQEGNTHGVGLNIVHFQQKKVEMNFDKVFMDYIFYTKLIKLMG